MSWRGVALALAAVALDLAVASCAGARRWAADEADRIDAVMGVGSLADGGEPVPDPSDPLAMGPAPPLAAPTSPRQQLTAATPWSAPPRTRGSRWYLGRRRQSPPIGRDSPGATR
ncbi:MAG TPA: hypothetical protein VFA20_17395 [Myxococcaceae bacterium]|nr:hypothetical protein [Myxococcaceae bacterium]